METSNPIGSFEMSCAQAEAVGRAAVAAARRLEKAARGLEQAAHIGDATKLGKLAGELNAAITDSDDAFKSAGVAWPHSEADVSAYLEGPFGDELLEAAQKSGCK